MEFASMSERILRSIDNIITNDPELQDFTIVPTEDNTRNKSPVLYEQHHLGIESWCIKYVYQYVCSELFKVRKLLAQRKMGHSKKENLNYLLTGALFINPDVTTFWNMRRELLESDVLNYEGEFRFSKLVLTRKNKSNEAFAYRRWLLKRIIQKMSTNGVTPPFHLVENELSISFLTALNTQNNYHAWTHRMWCVEEFSSYFPDLVLSELEFSEKWVSEHVSENTGYHYRQYLISSLKRCKNVGVLMRYFEVIIKYLKVVCDGEPTQLIEYLLGHPLKNCVSDDISCYVNCIVLLLYELFFVIENINRTYTEHESLWLHRRYVIFTLLKISNDYLGEPFATPKQIDLTNVVTSDSIRNLVRSISNEVSGEKRPKMFKSQPSKLQDCNLYGILCECEKSFISKNSLGSPNQTDLCKRHEKWLKYVMGVEIA